MLVVYKVCVLYKICIKMYNLNVFFLVIVMLMEISMCYFNIYFGCVEIYIIIFLIFLGVGIWFLEGVNIIFFMIYFINRCGRLFNNLVNVVCIFKIDMNLEI